MGCIFLLILICQRSAMGLCRGRSPATLIGPISHLKWLPIFDFRGLAPRFGGPQGYFEPKPTRVHDSLVEWNIWKPQSVTNADTSIGSQDRCTELSVYSILISG